MPEPYDLDATRQRQTQARAHRAELHHDRQPNPDEPPPHLHPDAIAACQLCDTHGTRQGFPCDHTDRTHTNTRGIALIRAQMGWKTPNPPTTP